MPDAPERTTRPHLSTRSKARKRALDILFESELRGVPALDTLAERTADAAPPVRDFTTELVRGVHEHALEIDQRIAENLNQDWTLERMPRVDRVAARIAVYEIDHTGLAAEVAVSEAVALVQELSTDESPAFLNGLLRSVVDSRSTS